MKQAITVSVEDYIASWISQRENKSGFVNDVLVAEYESETSESPVKLQDRVEELLSVRNKTDAEIRTLSDKLIVLIEVKKKDDIEKATEESETARSRYEKRMADRKNDFEMISKQRGIDLVVAEYKSGQATTSEWYFKKVSELRAVNQDSAGKFRIDVTRLKDYLETVCPTPGLSA